MAKRQPTFLEQADALQQENKRLKEEISRYVKVMDLIAKTMFGRDARAIHKLIEQSENEA